MLLLGLFVAAAGYTRTGVDGETRTCR